MKVSRRSFLAAVAVGAPLVAVSGLASAAEDPIPGVDVVVEKVPPGHISRVTTDPRGYLPFRWLSPGNYFITDRHGNKASIKHPGGPVRWRLVEAKTPRGPGWTLVDESDPL